MSASEAMVARAFLVARKGEAAMRDAVRAVLSRAFGPLWHSQIPEELTTEWKRVQEHEQAAGGPIRGQELLEYATIGELASLINKFWPAFESHFKDVSYTQSIIGTFSLFRNALMHGAELTEEECESLFNVVEDLTALCTGDQNPKLDRSGNDAPPVSKQRMAPTLDSHQKALLSVVNRAIEAMSGIIIGERDALLDFLRSNLARCSPEALAQVQSKFDALPDTRDAVESISQLLPPLRPPMPKDTKDVSKWLGWASRFYIPYQRWLIRNNLSDPEVAELGLKYEKWLHESYPELLGRSESLVVSTYKVVKQHIDSRKRVLWLVVDNLSGLWLADFLSAVGDAGIQITEIRRMLSMLPSATSISRRSMLSGRLPAEAVKFASEADASRQLWHEQGVSSIAFCTSLQEAERAVGESVELIILIYNRLDFLAHDTAHPGFEREEEMVLAMRNLTAKTGQILRKMQSIGPAKLIVSTDHGATWPGPSSQVVKVPGSALEDGDFEKHRRFIRVQDTTGLNEVDWFILKNEAYGLPATYAVTRGQRYIGMRPRAFTHGGLSPEETTVTLLVGDVEVRAPMELVLSQATPPLRLGRHGSLAILVRNPFDIPVEDLEISIPGIGVNFGLLDVPARSEAVTAEQEVTLSPKLEVHEDAVHVRVSGRYEISGKSATLYQPLVIKVRVLYQSSINDLEDMLNV